MSLPNPPCVPGLGGSNSAASLLNPPWCCTSTAPAISPKFSISLALRSQLHTLPEEGWENQAPLSPFCPCFAYLKPLITLHLKLLPGLHRSRPELPVPGRMLGRQSTEVSLPPSPRGAQIWPHCSSSGPALLHPLHMQHTYLYISVGCLPFSSPGVFSLLRSVSAALPPGLFSFQPFTLPILERAFAHSYPPLQHLL